MALVKNPSLKWVIRSDGAFVYDSSKGSVKVINETGVFILQRCQRDVTEIADELIQVFDVPDHLTVLADIQRFLQQMVEEGYLCQGESTDSTSL